ncbi:hypothetical protein [Streptomyces broussonetiae]|uniref:Uncharacterized protein n=1 Tax=Streptomyces broussonetiae TaxID=2686304 RepID=A0ABV5EJ36_9ACTN
MAQYSNAEIDSLLKVSDEALYVKLSNIVLGEGLQFGPEDGEERRAFGARWFAHRRSEIQKIVCESDFAAKVRGNSESGDASLTVATVADGVAAMFGKPAALVIAILVVRMGMDKFCAATN